MRTFLKIVFIVVVAAVIIGAGIAIFNAGMMQGAAMSGQSPDGATVPYYAPYYRPWGWGFGCFILLALFLFFPLILGLGRLAFGPRHGWHHGPWRYNGDQIPPRVEELHRRLHEKMNQPPTPLT